MFVPVRKRVGRRSWHAPFTMWILLITFASALSHRLSRLADTAALGTAALRPSLGVVGASHAWAGRVSQGGTWQTLNDPPPRFRDKARGAEPDLGPALPLGPALLLVPRRPRHHVARWFSSPRFMRGPCNDFFHNGPMRAGLTDGGSRRDLRAIQVQRISSTGTAGTGKTAARRQGPRTG